MKKDFYSYLVIGKFAPGPYDQDIQKEIVIMDSTGNGAKEQFCSMFNCDINNKQTKIKVKRIKKLFTLM